MKEWPFVPAFMLGKGSFDFNGVPEKIMGGALSMRKKERLVVCLALFSWLAVAFMPGGKDSSTRNTCNVKTGEGIRFIEGDWNLAIQEAREQKKYIFLDAYASWCGPCRMLKRRTFTDKEAGAFFNANFINVAVNMEKGIGPELSQRFQVDAYPTLIILNEYGKVVTFTEGYMNAAQLIDFGRFGLSKKTW